MMYVAALAIVAMMVLPAVIVTDGMSGYATAESGCNTGYSKQMESPYGIDVVGASNGNHYIDTFFDGYMYDFIYENYRYRIISLNEVSFIGLCAQPTSGILDLNIPEVVIFNGREYTVTEISGNLFLSFSPAVEVHITIPKTVEAIGKDAIKNIYKEGSTLVFSEPSSLKTIGDRAFMGCTGLTFSAVPSSVKYIGKDAFNKSIASGPIAIPDCTEFEPTSFSPETKLVIGDGNPYYSVDDGAIYSKDGTELIRCPNPDSGKSFQIKNTVKSIGDYAFYKDSNINGITFQEGSILESIGNMAFYESGIQSVEIPASVVHIGGCESLDKNFFDITSNSNFHLENNILYSESGVLVKAFSPSYAMPNDVTITEVGPYAFYYSDITSFDFASIERIGEYAFYGTNLKSVTIPACTEYIGEYAFYGNSSLNSLTFADGNESLTRIEDHVFDRCSSITVTVKIPNNVEHIGEYAFNMCPISDLVLGPKVSDVCMMAFGYVEDSEIDIPASLTDIHGAAFASGAKYNVNAGNRAYASDGNGVLYGIDGNGTKISIVRAPNGLSTFRVPDTIKTIDMYSFYWNDVAAIEFGDNSSLQTIECCAFYHTENLKSINLPESLEKIGYSAFNSSALSSITFPTNGNLKVILSYAFSSIESDDNASITIPGYVKQVDTNAFLYYNNLFELTVEYGVELYYATTTGCERLENLTIPSSVDDNTQMIMQVFSDDALKKITIGSGVKISNRTFSNVVFKYTDGQKIEDLDEIPGHSYTRGESEEGREVMIMDDDGTLAEVRCEVNDGTGSVVGGDIVVGRKYTFQSLSRDGYTFLGWSGNSEATEPEFVPGDEITVTEDCHFYAVWSENPGPGPEPGPTPGPTPTPTPEPIPVPGTDAVDTDMLFISCVAASVIAILALALVIRNRK